MRFLVFCLYFAFFSLPAFAASETIAGAKFEIQYHLDGMQLTQKDLLPYLRWSAAAAKSIYGIFPVKKLSVEISPNHHFGDFFGREEIGEKVELYFGTHVEAKQLNDDWTATHEMIHLGFPSLEEKYLWMQEGMATYLEPLGRARIGRISPEEFWSYFFNHINKGLPADGEQGLNHTQSWASVYWGGALFWFIADLRIREATNNKQTILTVFRGILSEGGDASEEWEPEEIIKVGDQFLQKPLLKKLYDEMAEHRGKDELYLWWKKLGVEKESSGTFRFNDKAPCAHIRKSFFSTPR